MDGKRIIETAVEILRSERDAINAVANNLGETFVEAIEILRNCKASRSKWRRQILFNRPEDLRIDGIHRNPSIPLHPVDALHGDLGRVRSGDAVIILSNSGSSDEILEFTRSVRRLDVATLVMTCRHDSPLAKVADVILDIGTLDEACPLGVAPSTTTTAMLALGDALTLTLSKAKGFTLEGFASNHPNGSLGKKLRPVTELARPLDATATVLKDATVLDALNAITNKKTGAAFIVDETGQLTGVFTDGDLRRLLQQDAAQLHQEIYRFMTTSPTTLLAHQTVAEGMYALRQNKINSLPVIDSNSILLGYLDIQDT